MSGKWSVQKVENCEYIAYILAFLLDEYSRIFGCDIMFNADCVVYNDPNAKCPRFIHSNPLHIRLSQKDLGFWSQTVFQLSHEMCHYAMYQTKGNKDFTLSWFEEIVCEAASLYALEYAAEEWSKCKLSQTNPAFSQNHRTYLEDELMSDCTDDFMLCDSIEKLIAYEKEKKPEMFRGTHGNERNRVYRAISHSPLELKCVLDYSRYVNSNSITINFDKWIQDNPCDFLKELKKIQPVRKKSNE